MRRLSSSTRNWPSSSRIRSTPLTCTRTPLAGSMPAASRWKWALVRTSRRGTTPSASTWPGAVDVGQEPLQRLHPLPHRPGDGVPLDRVEDPRDQVERERALLARVGEGHAPVGEDPGELVGPGPQIGHGQRLERGEERLVRRARLARGGRTSRPRRPPSRTGRRCPPSELPSALIPRGRLLMRRSQDPRLGRFPPHYACELILRAHRPAREPRHLRRYAQPVDEAHTTRGVLTPRWVLVHLAVVVLVVAFLVLGWWQFGRAASGNLLSFGYAIQWPAFAAFVVYVWIKEMRRADAPSGRPDADRPVPPPPVRTAGGGQPPAGRRLGRQRGRGTGGLQPLPGLAQRQPAPVPVRVPGPFVRRQMTAALTRFRVVAYIVGVLLLLLVFVAMPLRYIWDDPTLVSSRAGARIRLHGLPCGRI